MKCSESKAITVIICLLSVVPLCLVDRACECGDGLQPIAPSYAEIEHPASYNGSFDNCEDNQNHYWCSSHQLFNCSTYTDQYYEWSEVILQAYFTNPLQQVKVSITYFILNASKEVELVFLQYNGTSSNLLSGTTVPLPSNKQQFAFRLPSAGFDGIFVSHSRDGSIAIKRIIFCSEPEASEPEGSEGELGETLPTMMETTGKEGSGRISSTVMGTAGGSALIMILVVLAILVLVVRWSYKKRHNNSTEQDRVDDEVVDMKSNQSYDAINQQSHDEAKPSDHQHSYLIDPEELALYEEGTIKMETNSSSQKSTEDSKADVVEKKASEPHVQPDEVYHKEDND